jgi:hypothetical protein
MRRAYNVMRMHDERAKDMRAEQWCRVNVRGINPYTIDRVVGTYTVEFDRTGRSMPIGDWYTVSVKAYDVRCPDGTTCRFARLKDAKTFAAFHRDGTDPGLVAALVAGRRVT